MIVDEEKQNYISSTLYHFVGRSAGNDDYIFGILTKILTERQLLFDPDQKKANATPTYSEDSFHKYGEISTVPAVCFCDIPRNQLSLHIGKYSNFGIGFSKERLIKKGVRPVWYIPKNSYSAIATSEKIESRFPSDLLRLLNSTSTIIKKLTEGTDIAEPANVLSNDPIVQRCLQSLHMSHFFLLGDVAWFFKFFDASLQDDDPNNYYFEREWRKVNADLSFDQKDIDRIIVPSKAYKDNLVQEFPSLKDLIELL